RTRIAQAIGVPLAALEGIEFSSPFQPPPESLEANSREWAREALQGRADVLAALAEYSAAESALRLELAKQYPNVHLSPGLVWDQGERKWQLCLTVYLPLPNRKEGPIAEADARRAQAGARLLELQSRVLGQIEQALALLQASQRNLIELQAVHDAQAR